MTKTLFETAKPILEQLLEHQFQAFFVGGSVRDYLMGKSIHDIDITTSATPDEIESIFPRTVPIGREHGTINVIFEDDQYEVTTFRAEGQYSDHRRPNEVYFVRELYEDVKRRDFTMNAIAMDINYHIHDYFEGYKDIKNNIIRTVGDPIERFTEDALRILRGLRFQSQLSFNIEPSTYEAMKSSIQDISHLSIERIVVELTKLTQGTNVEQSFENLKSFNAFEFIPFFNQYDLSKIELTESTDWLLFLAILKAQQPYVNANLSELKISNNDKKQVSHYESLIQALPEVQSKNDLKVFVYDFGKSNILHVLSHHTQLNINNIAKYSPLIINKETIEETASHLPIMQRKDIDINGKDMIEYTDKKSGPWIKVALRQIEVAIIKGEVKNLKSDLLEWVKVNVKIS